MTDHEELREMLDREFADWEDQAIEYKRSLSLVKEGVRALVERCNAGYAKGAVLFGVGPDRIVCGVDPGDKDTAQKKLIREIDSAVAPKMIPEIFVMESGAVEVVALVAHRPPEVPYYTHRGSVRIRVGSHSQELTAHEADRVYRERERRFWPGPWACDACHRTQHRFAGAVMTDEGILDVYTCPECEEGELWPLKGDTWRGRP